VVLRKVIGRECLQQEERLLIEVNVEGYGHMGGSNEYLFVEQLRRKRKHRD
jgi:hypothetical protein